MNFKKNLIVGLLFSSMFTIAIAQDSEKLPTPNIYYKYSDLKQRFQKSFTNTDALIKPLKAATAVELNGTKVTLVPRKSNDSPFAYKLNDNDNAIRLFYEPNNSQFNNLYLGALYSGVKIKNNPTNFAQWRILQRADAYLTGKVTSKTNNIVLRDDYKKNIFFQPTANYITGAQLPTQSILTTINGSYSSNNTSSQQKVDLGAGYGPVSVDMSMAKSTSSGQSVIRVAAISKIYSLDVSEIYSVQSKNKTDLEPYLSELQPSNYPMYVSSIDYGFAIVAEISMNSLDQSTQASVKAQVETGLASGNVGVDFQNAFSNTNVNVSYTYHGINPSSQLKNSGTITDIVNMMRREIDTYMKKFARSNSPAIPLSCTFKYLYPKDLNSEANNVKINNLLLANQYLALANKPKFGGELRPRIVAGFMDGVPDGNFVSYGKCYVTFADNSKNSNKSASTWWFYTPAKKSKNISESKYKNNHYDILSIKQPEIDANGNFHLYVKLIDDNCTPKHTEIRFGEWQKSDNTLNINDLKSGSRHTINFFNGDVTFDLAF